MHKGRFLSSTADSTLCSVCSLRGDVVGRLTEAGLALTVKVLRFVVTLISPEQWLQMCGPVTVTAPSPCS